MGNLACPAQRKTNVEQHRTMMPRRWPQEVALLVCTSSVRCGQASRWVWLADWSQDTSCHVECAYRLVLRRMRVQGSCSLLPFAKSTQLHRVVRWPAAAHGSRSNLLGPGAHWSLTLSVTGPRKKGEQAAAVLPNSWNLTTLRAAATNDANQTAL